ncbi:MAG: cellulase family glycosylhydrolase [Chloroflexota bacterium]
MKKRILFFNLVIVLSLAMASGCGSPATATPPESVGVTPTPPTAISRTPSIPQLFPSMQLGNDLPQIRLTPRTSQELPNNHIGAWFEDYGRYYDTDLVYRNGFKHIRIGSLAGTGQYWGTVINAKTLSPQVDNLITEYAENGITIDLILASGSGLPAWGENFKPGSGDFENYYLPFISFVAQHFKGRIAYYEIWNEPVYIAPQDYIEMVKQAVPVIRGIDPDAKIIIGAMHGTWVDNYPGYGQYQRNHLDLAYLNEIIESDIVAEVDGISWHPFYDNIPGDPYYQNYPQMVHGIKELAASHGFTGEYFADEILWVTVDESDFNNGPPVTPLIAAKYATRSISEHRGVGVNVTMNTWFLEPEHLQNTNAPVTPLSIIHNLCDTLAGAEPTNITVSLEIDAEANIRHYAFTLPNGERLVALWTNDEAVENDPGVKATLTFPDSSAQSVTGIDVFNGFEQELVTENENGNLVIRNLLVKDYPIILRFSGANFTEPGATETPLPTPFAGVWEGTDVDDGSTLTVSLQQIGKSLTGRLEDTYSDNVNTPGFEGNGSGFTLSDSTAQMTFDLSRPDGKSVQLHVVLTLSNQNNTLMLASEDIDWSVVLQRK